MGESIGQSVVNAVENPFLMSVEDVFCLQQGRMVMLTGRIERGRVRKGDEVEIVGLGAAQPPVWRTSMRVTYVSTRPVRT